MFFNYLTFLCFFSRSRTSQDQRKKPQRTQLLLCRSRNMHHAFLPQPELRWLVAMRGMKQEGLSEEVSCDRVTKPVCKLDITKYLWCIGLLTIQRILTLMAFFILLQQYAPVRVAHLLANTYTRTGDRLCKEFAIIYVKRMQEWFCFALL